MIGCYHWTNNRAELTECADRWDALVAKKYFLFLGYGCYSSIYGIYDQATTGIIKLFEERRELKNLINRICGILVRSADRSGCHAWLYVVVTISELHRRPYVIVGLQ
jgi:hypothetical protein